MMALVTPSMVGKSPPDSVVLDIAPTRILSDLLRGQPGRTYASIDFDPAADGRAVDVQASVTELPIRSGTIGFVICSHVLEHVRDDRAAAAELTRILDPGGVALIQVPRRLGVPTDEDPSAGPEERKTRFGQADHVRYYGEDFEDRLEEAGLEVFNTSFSKILPFPLLRLIGAGNDEELWIATTGADPRAFIDTHAATRALARSLMASHAVERELVEARADAIAWQSHYEWLRNRPVVRLASSGKQALKKITSMIDHSPTSSP